MLSALTREQKQGLGILQIATVLEYFDLMLYIHMAVLLNELFFPNTDAHSAALLAAFTFCSTFIMRPFGALIFGWMGDNVGRKSTILVTTMLMAISCIVMANVPTYAQIGIAASWIVTLCRMAQGLSSMSETVGAQIYISECIPRPASYPLVSFLSVSALLGSAFALGVSTIVMVYCFNWRLAYWIGAFIATVGAFARMRLRETPDFLKLKRLKMQQAMAGLVDHERQLSSKKKLIQQEKSNWNEPLNGKTLTSLFLNYCGWPLSLYIAFFHFIPVLKNTFGYTPAQITLHDFALTVVFLISSLIWTLMSYRIHPLKILKIRWVPFCILMLLLPYLLNIITNPLQLFIIQSLILIFNITTFPADAIFIYHLPIYRRFTLASFFYAISRVLIYCITSFGTVYLTYYLGTYGLWVISIPVTLGFFYSTNHFIELEKKAGIYPNLTRRSQPSPQDNDVHFEADKKASSF